MRQLVGVRNARKTTQGDMRRRRQMEEVAEWGRESNECRELGGQWEEGAGEAGGGMK